MKKALVLVLVAAVMFSSGCLEGILGKGETIGTGYGVIVETYEPDFSDIETGDNFDLYFEVQNNGGSDATSTNAHLYDWHETGKVLGIGTLSAPDELAGLPGDIYDGVFDVTAPSDLPEGVVYTYTPKVRLMYKYKTTASTIIPALKKDEYKRLKERNQLNIPPVTTDVSKGPLAVSIAAQSPVIIDDVDDTLDFRINIDLLGKGTVYNHSASTTNMQVNTDDLDKIEMTILTADGIAGAVDCDAYISGEAIEMRRGKTAVYSCELNVSDFIATKNIPITIEINYNYFEDFSTSVTVTGE